MSDITYETKSKILELIVNSKTSCEMYEEILKIVEVEKDKARGEENSKHYRTLTKLINNENNAGWDTQSRHSSRIEIINNASQKIVDNYEEYLP